MSVTPFSSYCIYGHSYTSAGPPISGVIYRCVTCGQAPRDGSALRATPPSEDTEASHA